MIVDAQQIARRGLRATLKENLQYRVCADAADGVSTLALAAQFQPDVVIVDPMSIPGCALEQIVRLKAASSGSEILIFTESATFDLLSKALRLGVRGYVLKSDRCAEVIAAVASLARRRPYLSMSGSGILSQYFSEPA